MPLTLTQLDGLLRGTAEKFRHAVRRGEMSRAHDAYNELDRLLEQRQEMTRAVGEQPTR